MLNLIKNHNSYIMNIPIIVIHRGTPFYLYPVLKQMRLFNPDNRICLISDGIPDGCDFVEYHDINDYWDSSVEFDKIYLHLSSNPRDYEMFCFQRWFVIRDFVQKQGFEYFLCVDSDVLLYCDVNNLFGKYLKYDVVICNEVELHCSLFSVDSLIRFCDHMTYMYTNEQSLTALKDIYQTFLVEKKLGGICDMTAFSRFKSNVDHIFDIGIPVDGACFDENISVSTGFEMEGDKKKIYWNDNLPYGRSVSDNSMIRFYCLHFQGRAKYSIYKYLLDEHKVHHSGFWYNLKWSLSKEILGARLKWIKKAIQNPRMVVNFVKAKLK